MALTYSYSSATNSYTVTGGCGGDTAIVIPSTHNDGTNGVKPVTNIGFAAFFYCTSLVSITIPTSVTSIQNNAFTGCSSLLSIDIPSSVTFIGQEVFSFDCNSLMSINVSASNTIYASSDGVLFNKNLTTLITYPMGKNANSYIIPSSVSTVGLSAFYNCSLLSSIIIPSSVTSISPNAFTNCSSLLSINIPSSVTIIGINAFSSCSSLSNVIIPNSISSIQFGTFVACISLVNINIPDSVTSIGGSAFSNCVSLTRINFLGNAPTLGSDVFGNTSAKIYRKKNFVTGWSSTFGGKPVVLISDNMVKSGGTGKLKTKNKKASIQIIAKTTNLPPPPIPRYNLEGVYNYIGQFNGKNQYRRRAEDDPAFQYYLTFANDRWGIGLTVPPEIPQFLQTSSDLGDTLYPWIPYWIFITVIQL